MSGAATKFEQNAWQRGGIPSAILKANSGGKRRHM